MWLQLKQHISLSFGSNNWPCKSNHYEASLINIKLDLCVNKFLTMVLKNAVMSEAAAKLEILFNKLHP
jgi:hypothetical protein